MSKEYEPTREEIDEHMRVFRERHLKQKKESKHTCNGPSVPRLLANQPKANIIYKRFYDW